MLRFSLERVRPKEEKPSEPIKKEESPSVKIIDVTKEIWVYLPDQGVLVSNLGFVLRLSQQGSKITPGNWDKQQWRYTTKDKNKKTWKVAHLVALAFLAPSTDKSHVLTHIDEDPSNNQATNLAWDSQKSNLNSPQLREYVRLREFLIKKNRRKVSLENIIQKMQLLDEQYPLKSPIESEG